MVDDHKLRLFYEKRMGAEVEADHLGDEWKGYILRIAGGNDKQGFPMKQGVLTNSEYQHRRECRKYSVHLREAVRFIASVSIHTDTVK